MFGKVKETEEKQTKCVRPRKTDIEILKDLESNLNALEELKRIEALIREFKQFYLPNENLGQSPISVRYETDFGYIPIDISVFNNRIKISYGYTPFHRVQVFLLKEDLLELYRTEHFYSDLMEHLEHFVKVYKNKE